MYSERYCIGKPQELIITLADDDYEEERKSIQKKFKNKTFKE